MNIADALNQLNKENVLRVVNFKDIYNKYLGDDLQYNRSFSSPFRKDKNPSFVINGSSGYYKDYATGDSGDCFSFVKKMYNVDFYNALKQIVFDLNKSDNFMIADKTVKDAKKLKVENMSRRGTFQGEFSLKVKTKKLNEDDIKYWNSYGISQKYLRLGNIHPISHYFINGSQISADKLSYVFVEVKDNKESYKVYQPYSTYMKWINGNDFSVWELWRLLPQTYDKLIITSSRKDALSIIENLQIPATSFQAESINPKPHIVDDILSRFKKVYLLYDNDFKNPDNPGQTLAHKRIDQFDFINLVLPKKYNCKDFSDLVYEHGRDFSNELLQELILEENSSDAHIKKPA
jgi:hypothetical protein